jgi:hypothetical protein
LSSAKIVPAGPPPHPPGAPALCSVSNVRIFARSDGGDIPAGWAFIVEAKSASAKQVRTCARGGMKASPRDQCTTGMEWIIESFGAFPGPARRECHIYATYALTRYAKTRYV